MIAASVLIPAHNEAAWLPGCLEALLASQQVPGGVEVIVIANGCSDDTAEIAHSFEEDALMQGWELIVIELDSPGKTGALAAGEAAASGNALIYLDADVRVSTGLIAQLADVLGTGAPRYASGVPRVTTEGCGWLVRSYTRFWRTLPFLTAGVPGFGVFALNRAGRNRWYTWPEVISDDTFARLNFRPEERLSVPARYDWPMATCLSGLVRVRRRQDAGVREIAREFPRLMRNKDPKPLRQPIWRRALSRPVAFAVYSAIRTVTHLPLFRSTDTWARGR